MAYTLTFNLPFFLASIRSVIFPGRWGKKLTKKTTTSLYVFQNDQFLRVTFTTLVPTTYRMCYLLIVPILLDLGSCQWPHSKSAAQNGSLHALRFARLMPGWVSFWIWSFVLSGLSCGEKQQKLWKSRALWQMKMRAHFEILWTSLNMMRLHKCLAASGLAYCLELVPMWAFGNCATWSWQWLRGFPWISICFTSFLRQSL